MKLYNNGDGIRSLYDLSQLINQYNPPAQNINDLLTVIRNEIVDSVARHSFKGEIAFSRFFAVAKEQWGARIYAELNYENQLGAGE